MCKSRRELLGTLGLLGVGGVAAGSTVLAAEAKPLAGTMYPWSASDPRFDVRRFGAKADRTTDDTPTFQEALAAAGRHF